MDGREDLGVRLGPFGGDVDLAIRHILAPTTKDLNHIEGRAASKADEQHLHGPDADVPAAIFRRAVHHDGMSAAGLAQEGHSVDQLDTCFHESTLVSVSLDRPFASVAPQASPQRTGRRRFAAYAWATP